MMRSECEVRGCTGRATLHVLIRSGEFVIVIDPAPDTDVLSLCEAHYTHFSRIGAESVESELKAPAR